MVARNLPSKSTFSISPFIYHLFSWSFVFVFNFSCRTQKWNKNWLHRLAIRTVCIQYIKSYFYTWRVVGIFHTIVDIIIINYIVIRGEFAFDNRKGIFDLKTIATENIFRARGWKREASNKKDNIKIKGKKCWALQYNKMTRIQWILIYWPFAQWTRAFFAFFFLSLLGITKKKIFHAHKINEWTKRPFLFCHMLLSTYNLKNKNEI